MIVPLVVRFVGSQAIFGEGLALPRLLLTERVPLELHRSRARLAPVPKLRSALTGRSSGQPASQLRLLTGCAITSTLGNPSGFVSLTLGGASMQQGTSRRLRHLLFTRHPSKQYLTSSHVLAHFFRQVIVRPQAWQGLLGNICKFTLKARFGLPMAQYAEPTEAAPEARSNSVSACAASERRTFIRCRAGKRSRACQASRCHAALGRGFKLAVA